MTTQEQIRMMNDNDWELRSEALREMMEAEAYDPEAERYMQGFCRLTEAVEDYPTD